MSSSLACLRTSSRYTAVKTLRSRSPSRGSARAASMTPTGGASADSAGQYPNRRDSDPGESCSTCSSILTLGGRGACSPRSHCATTVWLASTASARARRDMPESSRARFSASLNASSSDFAAIVSLSTPFGRLSIHYPMVLRPDSPPGVRLLRTVVCVPCQPSGKFVRLPRCDGCPTKGPSREGDPHGQHERTSVQVQLPASQRGRGGGAGLPQGGHPVGQRGHACLPPDIGRSPSLRPSRHRVLGGAPRGADSRLSRHEHPGAATEFGHHEARRRRLDPFPTPGPRGWSR